MEIQNNVDITLYTTLRLPAVAPFFSVATTCEDVVALVVFAQEHNLSLFVLGGGSNIVIEKLDNTLVIKNEIRGITELDADKYFVGAGEVWDEFVQHTTVKGLYCLAPLSYIPGTVGGAPIQNIGAYGAQVGSYIDSVEVFDCVAQTKLSLLREECHFQYRHSIFKENPNRYIVTGVLFDLSSCDDTIPDYPGVRDVLTQEHPGAEDIRNAIIQVRTSKIPDWKQEYNVGSFFKNPEVSKEVVNSLLKSFPHLVWFDTGSEKAKIPAGWLIEHAGLKGFEKGNFKTYEKHALVIIHNGLGNFSELQDFIHIIRARVQDTYGIILEQEPIHI